MSEAAPQTKTLYFRPSFYHNDRFGHGAAELELIDAKDTSVARLRVKTTKIPGAVRDRVRSAPFEQGNVTLMACARNGLYTSPSCVFLKHDGREPQSIFAIEVSSGPTDGLALVYRGWFRSQKTIRSKRTTDAGATAPSLPPPPRGEELRLTLWNSLAQARENTLQDFTVATHSRLMPHELVIRKQPASREWIGGDDSDNDDKTRRHHVGRGKNEVKDHHDDGDAAMPDAAPPFFASSAAKSSRKRTREDERTSADAPDAEPAPPVKLARVEPKMPALPTAVAVPVRAEQAPADTGATTAIASTDGSHMMSAMELLWTVARAASS